MIIYDIEKLATTKCARHCAGIKLCVFPSNQQKPDMDQRCERGAEIKQTDNCNLFLGHQPIPQPTQNRVSLSPPSAVCSSRSHPPLYSILIGFQMTVRLHL